VLSGAAFGVALIPVAGAGIQGDRDCGDFDFQEDAQAVLDADPSDPHGLDRNDDGVACNDLPHRGGGPATTVVNIGDPPTTTTLVCPAGGGLDPRCPRLIVRVPTAPPGSFAPIAPVQPAPPATVTPGSPRFTG
jgi:hypothetical protein